MYSFAQLPVRVGGRLRSLRRIADV